MKCQEVLQFIEEYHDGELETALAYGAVITES